MADKLCLFCGKGYRRDSRYSLKQQRAAMFCSRACRGAAQRKAAPEPKVRALTGARINCKHCGKPFYVCKQLLQRKKFCSMACRLAGLHREKKPTRPRGVTTIAACKHCGNGFRQQAWSAKRRPGSNKFCSKACAYIGRELKSCFTAGHKDLVPPDRRGHTEETRKKIGLGGIERFKRPGERERLAAAHRGKKLSIEHIKKCLRRRGKSSLEIKVDALITKCGLPFRFVGDGQFFIERKNPDFIHAGGKKIAFEVFYSKHKEKFAGGLNSWMTARQEVFRRNGWELHFFNETQCNADSLVKELEVRHFK